MRLIKYIFLFLLLNLSTNAQVWNTVGSGIPVNWASSQRGMASFNSGGKIFVAYSQFNPVANQSTAHVKRWDGLVWQNYPNIIDFNIEDIVVYQNSIFVFGWNDGLTIGMKKFNGSLWTDVNIPAFYGRVNVAEVINGDLVVGGGFSASGGLNNIFSFNNGVFSSYPMMSSPILSVNDIHQFNGSLYLACKASGTGSTSGLLEYDGTNWSNPASFRQGTSTTTNNFTELQAYQNELYVFEEFNPIGIMHILGVDTIHFVKRTRHTVNESHVYSNQLFIAGVDSSSIGTNVRAISSFDGFNWRDPWPNVTPNDIAGLDTLNSEIYLFSKTTSTLNSKTYNHAFRLAESVVQGHVFIDQNANCIKDNNEVPISGALIKIANNPITVSDINGQYSTSVPFGNQWVNTVSQNNLALKNIILSCPLGTFPVLKGTTVIKDIGFSNPVPIDLITEITANRGFGARFGFNENYLVNVHNAGSDAVSGVRLKVKLPPTVNYFSGIPSYSSISGNELTYNLPTLHSLETFTIKLVLEVDPSSNVLGDSLLFTSKFDPIIFGDSDTVDNQDTLKQWVIGAYDPNDKQCSEKQIGLNTQKVDYHINFQNTGNDTAYKVTVVDTLDLNLPITSVVINSASHPYTISVSNNVMAWKFDNILLPDSGRNYYGSQGFVNFTINVAPGLAVGDSLTNKAQIYFDYQPPVITNVAKTLIIEKINSTSLKEESNLGLSVFPNPSKSEITILNSYDDRLLIKIIDTKGQLVDSMIIEPHSDLNYSILNLDKGMYLVQTSKETFRLIVE